MIKITMDNIKREYPLLTDISHNIKAMDRYPFVAVVYYEGDLECIIALDSDFFESHGQLTRYLFFRFEDYYDYRILHHCD